MPMHEIFIWIKDQEVGATSNQDRVPSGATVYRLLVPAFENYWDDQVYRFEKMEGDK